MWHTMLLINSILLALVSTYLVYSFGKMILLWDGKQFILTLIIWIFFVAAQFTLAALAEP